MRRNRTVKPGRGLRDFAAMQRPLALVTGVGSPTGIAAATCRALLRDGWSVAGTGWGPGAAAAVVEELAGGGRFRHRDIDLGDPAGPALAVDWAAGLAGDLDALVAAHARSLPGGVL